MNRAGQAPRVWLKVTVGGGGFSLPEQVEPPEHTSQEVCKQRGQAERPEGGELGEGEVLGGF